MEPIKRTGNVIVACIHCIILLSSAGNEIMKFSVKLIELGTILLSNVMCLRKINTYVNFKNKYWKPAFPPLMITEVHLNFEINP